MGRGVKHLALYFLKVAADEAAADFCDCPVAVGDSGSFLPDSEATGGGAVSLPSHRKVKFLGYAYRNESPLPNLKRTGLQS